MPTTTAANASPRTALYARVSTTGHGQDVSFNSMNSAKSPVSAGGTSSPSTSMTA